MSDDLVKLARYAIVSIRRGALRILPGGRGLVLVTENMTREAFVSWIIARYLASDTYRDLVRREPAQAVDAEERKFLRVSFVVLDRWPKPELKYEEKQLAALERILRALPGTAPPPALSGSPGGGATPKLPAPKAEPEPAEADDLTAIEGVGEKIAGLLAGAGITTYERLAATSVRRLREILSDARLGFADPGTWPEQARLAAARDRRPAPETATARGAAAGLGAEDRRIVAALEALGGEAPLRPLARETGMMQGPLRRRLDGLIAAGRVRRGEGLATRYHLVGK